MEQKQEYEKSVEVIEVVREQEETEEIVEDIEPENLQQIEPQHEVLDTKKTLFEESSSDDESEDVPKRTNLHVKDTVSSLYRKKSNDYQRSIEEWTQGLITGFRYVKEAERKESKQSHYSPHKTKNLEEKVVSKWFSQPRKADSQKFAYKIHQKAAKHHKTPRNGKYKNITLFSKRQKLKQIKHFTDMKQRHYENFLKSLKKEVKGSIIQFEKGEQEDIMRDYFIKYANRTTNDDISHVIEKDHLTNPKFYSDKFLWKDSKTDESTKQNSESTKVTTYHSGKLRRHRPRTVNKLRQRNPSTLYTIEENSSRALNKNVANQKSTAHVHMEDIGSATSVDMLKSTSKAMFKLGNGLGIGFGYNLVMCFRQE